jgi:Uma2 family endonuclease
MTVIDRSTKTLADLLQALGSIPPSRIPAVPHPGSATEQDILRNLAGEKRLYELVDGVLVEKPMGYYESLLAGILIRLMGSYVEEHDLGFVLGEAGTLRLAPGLVRIPDVSFISWSHFPSRRLPRDPIPDLAPDLAVEVISESNTEAEMSRKLREYFDAGTRVVWLAYPDARSVRVYSDVTTFTELAESDTLDGGGVVPGFTLPVADWFGRAAVRE